MNYDPCGTCVPLRGLVAQRASPETNLKEIEQDSCVNGRALVRHVQGDPGTLDLRFSLMELWFMFIRVLAHAHMSTMLTFN